MVEYTGNYKVCRFQLGLNREDIEHFKDRILAINYLNVINIEANWEYYCEEEVIYIGSHRDNKGNHINSAPTWRRMQL